MTTFEVWAPNHDRVRLRALGNDHEMSPFGDGQWRVTRPGRRPRHRLRVPARRRRDPGAGPALPLAAGRRARPEPAARRPGVQVGRRRLDRPAAGRVGGLRAARRHVHARGHVRGRGRPARPPRRARRRPGRGAAGQRGQRHPQLGLRRRRVVRGARAVRRAGRVQGVRRRLPPARARRRARRGLQPPRPVRGVPAAVRAVLQAGPVDLGRPGQPGRTGLRAGTPLHPGQRADVAARIPRGRAAAGRRARPGRPGRHAPARATGHRGRRAVRAPAPSAHAHRRVRPQRPAGWSGPATPAGTG